jgi:hypothetical protein
VAVVKCDDRGPDVRSSPPQLGCIARLVDRPAHDQRPARLGREQIDVGDHPQDLAALGHDGEMADPLVDHREHELRAQGARVGGHRGRAHRGADGRVERHAPGDHADAQVAVGEDPEIARGQADHRAARARVGHPLRSLADRGVGRARHKLLAQQRVGRQVDRRRDGLDAPPGACQKRPGDEAQRGGPRQQRHHVLAGQAIRDRVLGRASGGARREPGQHRRVAEPLALPEEVEHPPAIDQLHGPAAHDPHVAHPGLALPEDHLAGGERLDVDPSGEPLQRALVELAERLVIAQEADDLVHWAQCRAARSRRATGVSQPAPRPEV